MILHILLQRVYSLLCILALPLLFVRLCLKSLRNRQHLMQIGERFGWFGNNLSASVATKRIWVHAVSLGEVKAALPLINYLLRNYEQQIIVTTMTLTGAQCVQREFAGNSRVIHLYAPYDAQFVVERFIKHVAPKICLLMETEIWPSIIYVCAKNAIPLIILNARLSSKSVTGYQRYNFFFKPYLEKITMVCAQSHLDWQRFVSLGVSAKNCTNIGNIKFDINLPDDLASRAQILAEYIKGKFVIVAASTHQAEEEMVLQAYAQLSTVENVVLIIVPRHPERFNTVANLLQQAGYNYIRKTQITHTSKLTNEIILGDTIGELLVYYYLADICFVGGSLVPIGGHNLLEPAMLQKAIITGPFLDNFIELSQKLLTAHGVVVLAQKDNLVADLTANIAMLYRDSTARMQLAANAYQTVLENQGALARTSVILTSYL